MNAVPWVGYVAGTMTVVSYVPQAVRAWRTKQVHDLSWGMLTLIVAAGAMWIVYGVMSSAPPVIITNVASTIVTGIILVAKIKFRDNDG